MGTRSLQSLNQQLCFKMKLNLCSFFFFFTLTVYVYFKFKFFKQKNTGKDLFEFLKLSVLLDVFMFGIYIVPK